MTDLSAQGPLVTLALPCFNPRADQWGGLARTLADPRIQNKNISEILIIDDGSTHWSEPPETILSDSRVKVIRSSPNRGKGYVLRRAVRESSRANGIFVFTDFDMPYEISDLCGVIASVQNGVDLCIADRSSYFVRLRSNRLSRAVGHQVFRLICRIIITGGVFDTQAGLKAFKLEPLRAIIEKAVIDSFVFDVEWLYIALRHRLSVRCWPIQVLEGHASGRLRSMRYYRLLKDLVRLTGRIVFRRYDSPALVRFLSELQARLSQQK